MPEIGQTLSHFKIVEKIGEGGMGTVFLADDTTLDRKVALKFLPDDFTSDPERMARFEREAKLLASLNHPNIAGIYGLEQADGTRFLVLEYVEGETLQARLSKGALPLEDALELCRQVAEGLEAAHEKGVIHRDLKPANVMITAEEKVKILDFGLAKALSDETQSIDSSQSPTLTEAMTRPGVILGTAAYMSPEQAKGKSVDKRADIWAFGSILYECLTGKRAFEGETVTETLAAILKSEPDLNKLPPSLHPRIRFLLERSLEKKAKDRYGSISDARVDIQKVLADPNGVFVQAVTEERTQKKLRTMIPWIAVTALFCLIIAGIAGWMLKPSPPPEPKQVIRLEYEFPENMQFAVGQRGNAEYGLAISPDDSKFVYRTTDGLFLRFMNELTAKHISGTDKDSSNPFFSPDGQWIGYFSQSDLKLKKVRVSGGAPSNLCDISSNMMSASWDLDDTIVYSDFQNGIMKVSASGGTPETLIKSSLTEITKDGFPVSPQMLLDGDTLLFTNMVIPDITDSQIVVHSIKSGEQEVLFKGIAARYLPTGHIVYGLRENNSINLYAAPFDLDKLKVVGGSISVLEGLGGSAVSNSGTLLYVPQQAVASGSEDVTSSGNTLVWVDMQGNEEPLGVESNIYSGLNISPDGNKVALAIGEIGTSDIFILDITDKNLSKLTFYEATDGQPIWTPDGNRIVFYSLRNNALGDVFWKSADGTGDAELIGSNPNIGIWPWSLSPDGNSLLTMVITLDTFGIDIGLMSMEGEREMKKLLQSEHLELEPRISPDGQYMAYQSDASGEGNIYVCTFPNVNEGKWQVSRNGGCSPLWSPDGKELYYRNGDATIAVEVETEPTFKTRNSKTLFRGSYLSTNFLRVITTPWDIHPNGDKFLMIKPRAGTAEESTLEGQAINKQPKIIVVLNWFEALKQKVQFP